MIQLSKQQCGNCRAARLIKLTPGNDMGQVTEVKAADYAVFCHHLTAQTPSLCDKRGWCSTWELHPDYYEIFGFPSEEVQLEQQRMLLQMHGGNPEPAGINDAPFTYD